MHRNTALCEPWCPPSSLCLSFTCSWKGVVAGEGLAQTVSQVWSLQQAAERRRPRWGQYDAIESQSWLFLNVCLHLKLSDVKKGTSLVVWRSWDGETLLVLHHHSFMGEKINLTYDLRETPGLRNTLLWFDGAFCPPDQVDSSVCSVSKTETLLWRRVYVAATSITPLIYQPLWAAALWVI